MTTRLTSNYLITNKKNLSKVIYIPHRVLCGLLKTRNRFGSAKNAFYIVDGHRRDDSKIIISFARFTPLHS